MNLKLLRKNAGLTQQKVANICGITLRSYQNYEGGQREMGISTMLKLADYFGCSVDYLIGHQMRDSTELYMLSQAQKDLVSKIKDLSDQNCRRVNDYINGILVAEEEKEQIIRKYKRED